MTYNKSFFYSADNFAFATSNKSSENLQALLNEPKSKSQMTNAIWRVIAAGPLRPPHLIVEPRSAEVRRMWSGLLRVPLI